MSALGNIIFKEIKELMTPATFLPITAPAIIPSAAAMLAFLPIAPIRRRLVRLLVLFLRLAILFFYVCLLRPNYQSS